MESKTPGKKVFFMQAMALALVAVFLAGCVTTPDQRFAEVQRFKSYDEMLGVFEEARTRGSYGGMFGMMKTLDAAMPAAAEAGAADGSPDYSGTNVQVEGVDEADIVKTDGKYIYNLSTVYGENRQSNLLVITDAYPIDSAKVASKTDLGNIQPIELFVSGDRLLLFGNKYEEVYYGEPMPATRAESKMMIYPYWGGSVVVARLYDISDRANPEVVKEFEFEGSYLSSRMTGENAYFVLNSWPRYSIMESGQVDDSENIIPLMKEDGVETRIAEATDIVYIPPVPVQSFVTIASIDMVSAELQKETIAGSAESVYASQENIYIASTVWMPPEEPLVAEQVKPVVAPVQRLIASGTEETVINKFGLDDGKIGFIAKGEVPGRVLNQFSMDEFEGNFRIATTAGNLWGTGDYQSRNNLFVLGSDMKTIGRLEDLAPGEQIYSARFMGERAYMVTFKKVDPLFVIDLSDASNPKVLGKLKIPGYSDYLHPIDETHLIGVGKEAVESSYGDFAWYQGMKLAVFDVSDVANPVEMHKLVIGDRGTDSYALQDHKAFLYDKEKELLVLPIMLAEIPENYKTEPEFRDMPAYGEPVFQGAFVYRLTLENGFEERGRITHITEEEELKRGYYYGDEYSVKRSLYIGDVLYTLSSKMLKANSLASLEELKSFEFT